MELTKISVIIPTLNAADRLEQLVNMLHAQETDIAQILIIDSGSTDQTVDLAQKLETILIKIEKGAFDHGATRNLAADQADADILVFMTQDALPASRNTIGRLIQPLQDPTIVLSYARQVPRAEASLSEQYLRLANYPPVSAIKTKENIPQMGIKTFQNSNVCAAYRRKEFYSLGCFPQPVICNEDMLFAARAIFAGYKIAYTAEAVVWHTHSLSSKQLFRRYFDIAASLDHEPRIRSVGRAEAKGLDFLFKQLVYLKTRKKLMQVPRVFWETGAKYLGYKAGENHKRIPEQFKKYLGLNTLYWRKSEEKKVD